MKKNGFILVAFIWAALCLVAWFSPAKATSDAERRPLAQLPDISGESIVSGKFMDEFEDYALDQFPLRDSFRRIKSLTHYYVLGQKDNNGIYIAAGSAAKQEYPLNETSVNYALKRLNYLYETYLSESNVYMAVVPDKGYYLAQESGQLSMDYETLFSMVQEGTPWATQIDLTGALDADCYYRTDTHWRQETLLPAAQVICNALGTGYSQDYTVTTLERPFYGVYYGQAALPMAADTIHLLENDLLLGCTVTNYENGKVTGVYDMDKLESKDLYDVFLSGSAPLLVIDNPAASGDRELIVFRDSFGSSMVPLLVADYSKITVIDTRYIAPEYLGQFVDFHGQDTLMLYSTLLLNSSAALK